MQASDVKKWAAWVGSHKSKKKSEAARKNGKLGGRPMKYKTKDK